MTQKTYAEKQRGVSDVILEVTWKSIEDAGREEYEIASSIQNSVSCPEITVITDGAWSKRSYNANYNASSGVVSVL